jgi:hypothetical protein
MNNFILLSFFGNIIKIKLPDFSKIAGKLKIVGFCYNLCQLDKVRFIASGSEPTILIL